MIGGASREGGDAAWGGEEMPPCKAEGIVEGESFASEGVRPSAGFRGILVIRSKTTKKEEMFLAVQAFGVHEVEGKAAREDADFGEAEEVARFGGGIDAKEEAILPAVLVEAAKLEADAKIPTLCLCVGEIMGEVAGMEVIAEEIDEAIVEEGGIDVKAGFAFAGLGKVKREAIKVGEFFEGALSIHALFLSVGVVTSARFCGVALLCEAGIVEGEGVVLLGEVELFIVKGFAALLAVLGNEGLVFFDEGEALFKAGVAGGFGWEFVFPASEGNDLITQRVFEGAQAALEDGIGDEGTSEESASMEPSLLSCGLGEDIAGLVFEGFVGEGVAQDGVGGGATNGGEAIREAALEALGRVVGALFEDVLAPCSADE